MVRNQRKRIAYVLPLASDARGHKLGVNGLAVDPLNSILYSGGRDGVICAWDLDLDLTDSRIVQNGASHGNKPTPSRLAQQVQAHTHWVNDLCLAYSNEALVSASSDITVKVWRPHGRRGSRPQTIGLHEDYVKTLASPAGRADWVASGGLDRKIYLWDLHGAGERLKINVAEDESMAKGSVYALACTNSLLAAGGPDSIVRIWDPRSGKRVTKFVGHTDNIRDILISQDGDTVMSASSDQTVKVWSMAAGRCMHTLTMHGDSVWSLYSDHPRLSVFYSSDRSGLVAKTDSRGYQEIDDGTSVAILKENEGVNKIVAAGNHIWTATSKSSINRWKDVDLEADVQFPESQSFHRVSIATTRSRLPSPPVVQAAHNGSSKSIPFQSLLRLSNAAPFYVRNRDDATSVAPSLRKASEAYMEHELTGPSPVQNLPDYTIEGQHGLIKHLTLNNRRHVLTLDTNSEVVLWDLILCRPVKSFGQRHLDDVFQEINPIEAVAHWCAVDTRTGSLTCVLEENTAFDAEIYADESKIAESVEFKEDQRINMGKWVLRYLFHNLIDEEIKRDEAFRKALLAKDEPVLRITAPSRIELPQNHMMSWFDNSSTPATADTVRAPNGFHFATTPGLAIGLATPAVPPLPTNSPLGGLPLSPTAEEDGPLYPSTMDLGHVRSPSGDKLGNFDYFSQGMGTTSTTSATTPGGLVTALTTDTAETVLSPTSDANPTSPSAEKTGMFGKKMWKSLGMKGLKRTATNEAVKTAPIAEEAKSEDSESRSSQAGDERTIEHSFLGQLQQLRREYEAQIMDHEKLDTQPGREKEPLKLECAIKPSLPEETPVLKLPSNTVVLIQEDRVDSGGVADLFEGTVGSLGKSADIIEKVGPPWLADVLLFNKMPPKEIAKVSFLLEPYQNLLPVIATEGNQRLNANRMLRARKILAYVAERIEPQPAAEDPESQLRPEEYLELYCNDKLIPPTMTLGTIRAHVWRGGADVQLLYKANGRKEIRRARLHDFTNPNRSHSPPNQSTSPKQAQSSLLYPFAPPPPPNPPPAARPERSLPTPPALPAPPPLPADAQARISAEHARRSPTVHTRSSSYTGSHRSQGSRGSNELPRAGAGVVPRSVPPTSSNHVIPPSGARFSEENLRRPTTGGNAKKPEGNWI